MPAFRALVSLFIAAAALPLSALPLSAQSSQSQTERPVLITAANYSVQLDPGTPPRLTIHLDGEPIFVVPAVSALASPSAEESLSAIVCSPQPAEPWLKEIAEVGCSATSSLWTRRSFLWRFLPDHIEFQQFASGHGPLGRAYFLSSGVSNRWDSGTVPGHLWDTTIYADRYFAPNPNHANLYDFPIAMPQILGFSVGREAQSDQDFRPERMTGIFAPPPLFLAFHQDGAWLGVGIGTKPGDYQFPAFEYSGSRYAGASFFVDYQGYKSLSDGNDFASPVLSLTPAHSALDSLAGYTAWLDSRGFSTPAPTSTDVPWHHLPIFCGWAEQTVETSPFGRAPNTMATQANYEEWIKTLEDRQIPFSTIVIDDKWQAQYGTFEVDTKKWPDMKGFIAAQHAKGRHVLLWVPLANEEGLPADLCVTAGGKCVTADVGNPRYETWLRPRIHHLVADIGVDGFKEDWVGAPAFPGLPLTGPATGIEWVRRFQSILYSETHAAKPDAMVETQTVNALFRDSSDLTRLNDIWYGSRHVPEMMQLRARIAHISGWVTVDTDNASSTTLRDWWSYMQAQPHIGIPALYFITKTESTQEAPTDEQWKALAGLWRDYIAGLGTTR